MPQSNSSGGRMRTFTASLGNQRVCYSVLSHPHPPSLGRSSPAKLSSVGRMDTPVKALALLSCLGSNHVSFTSHQCGFLPTFLTFLMHRMGTMTMATLEGLVCVAGGGGGVTDVLELNKTVHQNSQCSKRIHSLWKTGWQVFKKLKIELLYDLGFHF